MVKMSSLQPSVTATEPYHFGEIFKPWFHVKIKH